MKMPGLSALAPWSSEMRIWVGGKKSMGIKDFGVNFRPRDLGHQKIIDNQ